MPWTPLAARSIQLGAWPSPSAPALRVMQALLAIAVVLVIGSPLLGWLPVLRLSAVLFPLIVAGLLALRPWAWTTQDWEAVAAWVPSMRTVWTCAAAVGLLLFWIVVSRFEAAEINGVDFTVYFDRPLFQTSQGRLYFVETTDDPVFAQLTHLAVHGYWILLPLAALYWIAATPLWLLALSVVAVVAGAIHVYRIVRLLGGAGVLACAAAAAFLLNDNTARTLNYGFHAEVLYAWFVPWMIDAGLRGARLPFLTAVIASVLVKEDACFPLFAASMALALTRWRDMTAGDRWVFLVVPPAIGLASLGLFYTLVVPALSPDGRVMYAYFWASHGPTPWHAAQALLSQPLVLLRGTWNSGFFSVVLSRHLFLPLFGWRWLVGLLPLIVLYGASDNNQLRAFGIYYAVPLVPFMAVASAVGTRLVARRYFPPAIAEFAAAALVLVGSLAIGLGYSLRPWKPETAAVGPALEILRTETTVLVQSGLYPHAGYNARVKLLAPYTAADQANAGAALLLAPRVSKYPFPKEGWKCLAQLPSIADLPGGLIAVRLTDGKSECDPQAPRQTDGHSKAPAVPLPMPTAPTPQP